MEYELFGGGIDSGFWSIEINGAVGDDNLHMDAVNYDWLQESEPSACRKY